MDQWDIEEFMAKRPEEKILGTFIGKDNAGYHVVLARDKRHDLLIEAVDFSGKAPSRAGYWRAYSINGKEKDPVRFLALPKNAIDADRFEPYVETEPGFQNRGIAKALLPYAVDEFQRRRGMLVASFRPGVANMLLEKYLAHNFLRAEVTEPDLIPRNLAENTDWIYRDFGEKLF